MDADQEDSKDAKTTTATYPIIVTMIEDLELRRLAERYIDLLRAAR